MPKMLKEFQETNPSLVFLVFLQEFYLVDQKLYIEVHNIMNLICQVKYFKLKVIQEDNSLDEIRIIIIDN